MPKLRLKITGYIFHLVISVHRESRSELAECLCHKAAIKLSASVAVSSEGSIRGGPASSFTPGLLGRIRFLTG